MSTHASRLARLFTPEYLRRINTLVVHPSQSQVVKPGELESAPARPLHTAVYEPEKSGTFLAASLSYGIIKGHPFMDGNKRTGFLVGHQYLRAQGLPGLVHDDAMADEEWTNVADRYIAAASGQTGVEGLLGKD